MSRSAKEYYYDVIAPEEQGWSYARVKGPVSLFALLRHMGWLGGRVYRISGITQRFKPRYSNDYSFNKMCETLIDRSPDLQGQLEKMFVVKRVEFSFEAFAIPGDLDYEGSLVFFQTGLWLATEQYVQIYVANRDLFWTPRDDNAFGKQVERVSEMGASVYLATVRWKQAGRYLQEYGLPVWKAPKRLWTQIGSIHSWIAYYIIAHEVAHHLLGHLSGDTTLIQLLETIPPHARRWSGCLNLYHAQEFQADALALLICIGIRLDQYHTYPLWSDVMMAFFASQLTFITLAHLSEGGEAESLTHPTLNARALATARICRHWLDDDEKFRLFDDSVSDFRKWQQILESTAPDYGPLPDEVAYLSLRRRPLAFGSLLR